MLSRCALCLTLLLPALLGPIWGQEDPASAEALLGFIPDVVADYGNGEQLRGAEIKPLLAPQLQAMLASGQKPTLEQVRSWAVALVDGIVNQRLVLREAERHSIRPDLEAGRRLVADQEERLGRKAFERALRLQGVNAEQLAQHLAENDAVNRWLETIAVPAGSVTETTAQAYYEQHPELFRQPAVYHVAHLLVAAPEDAPEAQATAARQTLEARRAQVAQGEGFASLAAAHSDCPSKASGGDLGPLPAGRLPQAFEAAALALEYGQISLPVRTPHGWHLIRGGTIVPALPVPLAAVQSEILATLRRQALDDARRTLIHNLRQQARVSLYVSAP